VVGRATREVSLTAYQTRCNESNGLFPELACYDALVVTGCTESATAMSTEIPENLRHIQDRISAAARRAGRDPQEITLIGVSKTHPASSIIEAFQAGVRHFGENRVQEWEEKREVVKGLPAKFHLIGHLQSNKAAKAAKFFDSVDSVDDITLAQRLDRARAEIADAKPLRVLVEVHMGEESKSGVSTSELTALALKISQLPQLDFAGLMAIPHFLEDPEEVRPYFAKLRQLRDSLESETGRKLPVLSMGMSHDFEAAIAEGATEIRVGTALFGTRPKAQ